ncbi:MAG: YeeE/YedE family protein [Deltaproteobacteria bacterium]|jgi:MFS family permease|nr:YeeE/YedE family protein [Deltaproteobacteria bacterium]
MNPYFIEYSIIGIAGLIFGVALERGRMCFVLATNNIFTAGDTKILEGILWAFGISVLAFGIVESLGIIPVHAAIQGVFPMGWYDLVGALLFGFGIGICGACMSGLIFRAASGFTQNWMQLFGILAGTIFFAFIIFPMTNFLYWILHTIPWLSIKPGISDYIPHEWFGDAAWGPFVVALIFGGFFLILGLYLTKRRFKKISNERGENYKEPIITWNMLKFKEPYSPRLGGLLFAVVAIIVLFASYYTVHKAAYLGVTTPYGSFDTYILAPFINLYNVVGPYKASFLPKISSNWFQIVPVAIPMTFLVICTFAGATITAILGGEFKWRVPRRKMMFVQNFAGGILTGVGARIALGCNIGTLWSGFLMFSWAGVLFLPTLVLGMYLALKFQELVW